MFLVIISNDVSLPAFEVSMSIQRWTRGSKKVGCYNYKHVNQRYKFTRKFQLLCIDESVNLCVFGHLTIFVLFCEKKKFKLFYMLAPFSPVISFFLLLTRRLKPEFRVDTILSWWEKLWYGCLYQNFDATSWIRSCVVTTNEVFIK